MPESRAHTSLTRSLPPRSSCAPRSLALQAFSTSRPSADYAKLSLIGRIGAEPVLKQNKNGKDFLVYKVATSDPYIPAKEGGQSLSYLRPAARTERPASRRGDQRADEHER